MREVDPQHILTDVFLRLRHQSGFTLGVGELLAAFQAVDGGWGRNQAELKQVARLLWCSSVAEQHEFEVVWSSVVTGLAGGASAPPPQPPAGGRPPSRMDELPSSPPLPSPQTSSAEKPGSALTALPIRAPYTPTRAGDRAELYMYWPVSPRFMAYSWRYLRRPIPDGPADVLDVRATVERAARQGFFLAPVYRRRERNHAHLILLIDQGGSMVPCHHFTRHMVETAQYESAIGQVDVLYFHNVPAASVYSDPYMTAKVPWDQVLEQCLSDTSVIIMSDAGAARGSHQWQRIRATTRCLSQLKQHTTLMAWLNPIPDDRWPGTSAQIIAHLVPMFQMDPDGFSNAIDVVRGQLVHHDY